MSNKKYQSQYTGNLSKSGGGDLSLLAREVNASNSSGVTFASESNTDPLFLDRLIDIIGAYAELGETAKMYYDGVEQ